MRAARAPRRAIGSGLLAVLAGASVFTGCASPPRVAPPVAAPGRPSPVAPAPVLRIGLEDDEGHTGVEGVGLEEYVAGCVAAELGTTATTTPAGTRMWQVQAILCRTFAVANLGRHAVDGYDLCASSHCQLYRAPRPGAPAVRLIEDAVDATRSVVIVYAGRPIQALYHAHCGGRTSAADTVWGGSPEPYLVSVIDSFCRTDTRWRVAIERDRLRDILNRTRRTAVGPRLDGVEVTARDQAERALTVVLSGTRTRNVRGEEFRTAVMLGMGPQSIRSARFWVRREDRGFVIEGSGSGHGVGLCQAGARARAEAGQSPEAIIRHYYPGASLALR